MISFALYCGAVALGAIRFDLTSLSGDQVWYLVKTLVAAPTLLITCVYLAWRFVKPFQMLIFPKLGGEWKGHISYMSEGEIENKDATLHVKHSFSGVVLILETEESVSHTLTVSPHRDKTGSQFKLYYVFNNERRALYCVPGRPKSYRGVAIIAFDRNFQSLSGQYFTEQDSRGNIEFHISKPTLF